METEKKLEKIYIYEVCLSDGTTKLYKSKGMFVVQEIEHDGCWSELIRHTINSAKLIDIIEEPEQGNEMINKLVLRDEYKRDE